MEESGKYKVLEAEKCLREGDKKYKKKFYFFTNPIDEAIELYERAYNIHKINKNKPACYKCLEKIALCHVKNGDIAEAGNKYQEAGKYIQSVDPATTVSCMKKAIELYSQTGMFKKIADCYFTMAQNVPDTDIDKYIIILENASQYYESCDIYNKYKECLVLIARKYAEVGDYTKSILCFKQLIQNPILVRYLKNTINSYIFTIGLLYLCDGDFVAADKTVKSYAKEYNIFNNSQEYNMFQQICDIYKQNNPADISKILKSLSGNMNIDKWYFKIANSAGHQNIY